MDYTPKTSASNKKHGIPKSFFRILSWVRNNSAPYLIDYEGMESIHPTFGFSGREIFISSMVQPVAFRLRKGERSQKITEAFDVLVG